MVFAVREGWDVAQVFWLFWVQSVCIGITYLLEVLLSSPSSIRLGILDRFANAVQNIGAAALFLLYYGGFHLVYALTLSQLGLSMSDWVDQPLLLIAIVLFLLSHLASFASRRIRKQSLNDGGIGPIARILPMHLGLVLGALFGGTGMILVMMGIKTLFDLAMEVLSEREKGERAI